MGRKSSTGRSAAFVFPACLFLARLRREIRPGILGDLHHLFAHEVKRLEVAVHHADDAEGRDEEGHEDEARHARIEAQPFTGHVARDDPDEHQERSFVTKKVGRNARGRGGARITKKEEELRQFIIHDLHSGATIYESIGAYNMEKRNEIITIVDKGEYQKLMNYMNREDPKAFITVYTVSDMRYQPKR